MKNTKLHSAEFINVLGGFEQQLVKEDKDFLSVENHISNVKEFLCFAEENGTNMIKSLEKQVVDRYFTYLEQERVNQRRGGLLSSNSIGKHQTSINHFLKHLFAEQIPVNAIHLKKRKRKQEKQTIPLSEEEVKWLYSVTDSSFFGYRDRCMLALYYGCGIRKSEGRLLLIPDIDFSKGRIHVRKTKTNRERYVMMSPKVKKQMEDYVYSARDLYLAEDSNHEHLFISERGVPMHSESIASRMKTLRKRVKEKYGSDLKVGCHLLRHSLGTHLYMNGMNIDNVALMLGHRTLESAQLYIHLANKLQPLKTNKNNEQI